MTRPKAFAVVLATIAAVAAVLSAPTPARAATGDDDWLGWLNHYRAVGAQAPVSHDPAFDAGPLAHATYLIDVDQTGLCPTYPHCEAIPPGTPEGDEGAQNVIMRSSTALTPREVVEGLVAAPFHALAMLRPGLRTVGFALYDNPAGAPMRSAGIINVSSDPSPAQTDHVAVWPANGARVPLVAYPGSETPDPLVATSCEGLQFPTSSGERVAGLPLIVANAPDVPRSVALVDETSGAEVTMCVASPSSYAPDSAQSLILAASNAFLVIPEQPLMVDHTYRVELPGLAPDVVRFTTVAPLDAPGNAIAPPPTTPPSTAPGATTVPPDPATTTVPAPTVTTVAPSAGTSAGTRVPQWLRWLPLVLGAMLMAGALTTGVRRRWQGATSGSFVAGAGLASMTGVFLRWGTARIGSGFRSYRGIDLPVISLLALGLAAAVVVAGLRDAIARQPAGRWSKALLAVMGSFSALLLLLTESVGALIPSWVLPKTTRRLTAEIQSGAGPWLALGLSAGALVVVLTHPAVHQHAPTSARRALRPFVGSVGVIVGLAAVAVGRALPWVTGSALGEELTVHGWAVPLVGPLSLAGVFALGAGAVLLLLHRDVPGLLVAGTGIGLAVFPAAALAATSGALARSGLIERFAGAAQRRFAAANPTIELGVGPWLVYAGGLVAAFAIASIAWEGRRANAR